jgi:hypothetical protein
VREGGGRREEGKENLKLIKLEPYSLIRLYSSESNALFVSPVLVSLINRGENIALSYSMLPVIILVIGHMHSISFRMMIYRSLMN